MVDQTSQFYAILTNVGAAKQANADALGIAWKITQMGVGDANGTDPTPNATQTSLINEWRRAPLNQLKVDDKNSAIIIAEQVIPADVGGKWIREIALYDADGDMVAVANCAPTYKPLLSQGSGRTQVVRMNLVVSSASNVQLKIDPAVVLATREWVTEELARQDFKHSVLAATTANINLSGLQTIDGVALAAGARVLVKNQTAAKDNGLYLVVASGAWTRCGDADSSAKVTPCMLVLVERGTVNGDSAWQLVTDAPISLGVTALAYEMAFGRTGVATGTYRSVSVDAYGRVMGATNPTTVAGYGLTDVYTKTQVDQSLALKAPLASPVLTGTPTAPTPAAGNNSTQLANTAFVQAAISALIASAPGALDTLNELAAALGNDPNFATTMTNALALKAALANPNFTGLPTAPTRPRFTADTTLATTDFVQSRGVQFNTFAASNQAGTYPGTIAHIGGVVHFWGDAQMAYTVPNSATTGAAMGAVVRVHNWSTGRLQITPQGSDKLQEGSAYAASNAARTIPSDTFVDLLHIGSGVWIMHGSGVDYLRVPWTKVTNNVGYAFSPSGMLEQWGSVSMVAPADALQVNVTFPLAFPNACLNLQTSIGVDIVDYDENAAYRLCKQQIHAGRPTKVGFEGQAIMDNYPDQSRVVKWRAIGY
ncbi:phage tail protein [Pseudomonas sp. NBRC 111123]|uniref:phage tail protein n=1 Tax=Pseudomonas sp. NBRC 111123 TaxID=1661038 RepID=UPI0009EC60DC|nr:phage tail protein [Pseudomonas sp. NBRC 111123]